MPVVTFRSGPKDDVQIEIDTARIIRGHDLAFPINPDEAGFSRRSHVYRHACKISCSADGMHFYDYVGVG